MESISLNCATSHLVFDDYGKLELPKIKIAQFGQFAF